MEVTPAQLDLTALPSTCTDEGMVLLPTGAEADPPLDNKAGTLGYEGFSSGSGDKATDTGRFTVRAGDNTVELASVGLGDQITVGEVTYSVTSMCAEAAEVDVIP